MPEGWKSRAQTLKRDLRALYLARRDPRIPWYARAFGAALLAYALSPIDLIPDFIPILGYLDDLVVLSLGVLLLVKMLPPHLLDEYRIKAENTQTAIEKSWTGAVVIVTLWACGGVLAFWIVRRLRR